MLYSFNDFTDFQFVEWTATGRPKGEGTKLGPPNIIIKLPANQDYQVKYSHR